MGAPGRSPRTSVRRPPGEGSAPDGSRAPASGVLAVAARRLGMSEEDIFDLALSRSAWRCMVVARLGASNVRLAWSKTPLPALTSLSELGHASSFAGVDRERILYDDSAPPSAGDWTPNGDWRRAHDLLSMAIAVPPKAEVWARVGIGNGGLAER
jgi:hypothetical protein